MNKKITLQFMVWTFGIMTATWGLCVICGFLGLYLENHSWLYVPYILGGNSPAIASYIVLKRNKEVTGMKEWLKNVFDFRTHILYYLFFMIVIAVYYVTVILVSGMKEMQPVYWLLVLVPSLVLGGRLFRAH